MIYISKFPLILINDETGTKPEIITGFKRLKGEKGAYLLRVGNYRIGLYIQGDTVEMARSIFSNTTTGLVDSISTSNESDVRVIELLKSDIKTENS